MADARPEPSMEDILASIKRIIADDAPGAPPRPSLAPPAMPASRAPMLNDPSLDDSVLELTNRAPAAAPSLVPPPAPPQERPADRFRQAVASARVSAAPAAAPAPSWPAPVDTVAAAPVAAPAPRTIPSLSAPTIATTPAPAAPVAPITGHFSGETIEGLVRGLVSDWLAANLPAITEKLVREEIARIRDAED